MQTNDTRQLLLGSLAEAGQTLVELAREAMTAHNRTVQSSAIGFSPNGAHRLILDDPLGGDDDMTISDAAEVITQEMTDAERFALMMCCRDDVTDDWAFCLHLCDLTGQTWTTMRPILRDGARITGIGEQELITEVERDRYSRPAKIFRDAIVERNAATAKRPLH